MYYFKNYQKSDLSNQKKMRSQIIRIMKLTCFILLTAMLQISATVYSQATRFDVQLENVTVKDIFKTIEAQSEFRFFYSDDLSFINKRVTLNVKDVSVESIMDKILDQSDLTYRIFENNLIVVTPEGTNKQGITITGTVTDAEGNPLPGASVVIKGTTQGTVTDINGKYLITVSSEEAILTFSFVGYAAQEIVVGKQRLVNIDLQVETREIEEVVVVGYGTQRKSDVTGSISVATSEDLLRTPSLSAITGLKGVASGVNVFLNSGLPGGQQRVVIRGLSSITAVSDPLYVVDGVIMQDFQFVNPNDIERIEVLKDASAAAIYGARGAAGVLLVTTKRGAKEGATRVSYTGWVSVSRLQKKMDVMNSEEFMRAYRISMQNHVKYATNTAASTPESREAAMNALWTNIARNSDSGLNDKNYRELFKINGAFNPEGWKNEFDNNLVPIYDTDWQDEATRNAVSHNHQLSIQQGGKNSSTGVFLNYTDNQGLFINTYMKRVNARLTNDAKLFNWLSSSMNLMVNDTWTNETQIGSGGQDALRTVIEMPPIFPVKYPDGNWSNSQTNVSGFSFEALSNPVHFLTVRDRMINRTQIFGNFALTFHLADGLDLKTQIGADGRLRNWRYYNPYGVINMDNGNKGEAEVMFRNNIYWQETTYLNYTKVHEQHRINAMVGVEWSESIERYNRSRNGAYPSNASGFDLMDAGAEKYDMQSSYTRWAMNSYIGRFAYTFSDKYMATLTARVDGSSKFGDNNKYAFFPAAGLGWNISNEDFMKNITWIDQLKLHTSYGITGNSEGLDAYRSLAVYGTGTILVNNILASSASPSRMANPDLRWERKKTWDIGFNLNTFKNRLNFDISYYYNYTDDLLLDAPIPSTSGYNSISKNIGAVSGRGWDILINGTIVSTKDFEWNATLNTNFNATKVEKLNVGNADMFVGDNWLDGLGVVMRVGEPMGCWWIYERTGIRTEGPGRIGEAIRSTDKKIIGKGMPDWTGSFMHRFRYKQLDFMADFQFVIGGKIRQDFFHSTYDRFGLTSGLRAILYDAWSPSNPNTKQQAIRNGVFDGQSSNKDSQWLADATYLRGNLFQLGYSLTPTQARFIGMSALRAYISVENLFVLCSKDFRGFDPEASSRGRFEQNAFFFQYPRPTTYVFGVNVTF